MLELALTAGKSGHVKGQLRWYQPRLCCSRVEPRCGWRRLLRSCLHHCQHVLCGHTPAGPGAAVRLIPHLCVMAADVATAYLGYTSFVTNLTNFLDVLLVIFIPWSAVNLADYFLVRRGHYDVASFFTADGTYGRFAWRGLLAYGLGLAAEWPFVSQPDYTGPLVKALGGADISWLVGWFAAAIIYLLLVAVTAGSARHERQVAATAR